MYFTSAKRSVLSANFDMLSGSSARFDPRRAPSGGAGPV